MKKSMKTYAIIGAVIVGALLLFKRGGIKITPNPAKQDSFFFVTVTGLLPNKPVLFGWEAFTGSQTTGTSSATGTFTWNDSVLTSTPIGNYTLFASQISSGGKRLEGTLRVIA